jgi:hypothetical protein
MSTGTWADKHIDATAPDVQENGLPGLLSTSMTGRMIGHGSDSTGIRQIEERPRHIRRRRE